MGEMSARRASRYAVRALWQTYVQAVSRWYEHKREMRA